MSNWVTVITFMYPHEAHLAAGVLESEEIAVFLQDELTTQVNNFYSTALGGVKLQVPAEEAGRALEILKEAGYIREPETAEEPEEVKVFSKEHATLCPYCNSKNVRKNRQPGYVVLLSFLLLHAPIPFFRKNYHCFDCGKEWKVKG